ncbi:uncharacterized protein LOC62_07G008912 [Vanrija pseudolonga]|uniref:Uncharacterized protein n=1 Tax=Vanrija pseudolonga TaxID=143232 RepID=A0AAF0YEU9_9TREE|nr:hypothetical protein LOC62_07G008912 [Vanrija pseudolonga]
MLATGCAIAHTSTQGRLERQGSQDEADDMPQPQASGQAPPTTTSDPLARPDSPPTPTPTTIDHAALPHIFDNILSHAALDVFIALRATSREMCARANSALYHHVCVSVSRGHNAAGREVPHVSFRAPYSGRPLPGLTWDARGRDRTLALLAKHTRVLDDRGSAINLSGYCHHPEIFEKDGGLALLASLYPDVVRASVLDRLQRPYAGWYRAVRKATCRRSGEGEPANDGNDDDDNGFPDDLDPQNPLHRRIAATRALLNGETARTALLAGHRPLLPAATFITFTSLCADEDQLVPVHGYLPSTTRVISNVTFEVDPTGVAVRYDVTASPPSWVTDVIVVFSNAPTGNSWTWTSGALGVLHTVIESMGGQAGRAHTVTLVGLEDMDPVYYHCDGSLSTPWAERKASLVSSLRAAVIDRFNSPQGPPVMPPTVMLMGPGNMPVPNPPAPPEPPEPWRPPTWRLLTFAEWRADVGDELYALATVAPWDPWPDILPHSNASMGR